MTFNADIAIVSETSSIKFQDAQRIAKACNTQMSKDYLPIWGRHCTVTAFEHITDVPKGYWKCIILDQLSQPGAAGFHTDEHGQPVAYIKASHSLSDTCKTCSHEILEMVTDPFGNRLIKVSGGPLGDVRILCEIADPSEDLDYVSEGLRVSDFYFPEWFDSTWDKNQKYSFKGTLMNQRIVWGGYCSYVDHNNKWWQLTWFQGSNPITQGPFNWSLDEMDEKSLREIADKSANSFKP